MPRLKRLGLTDNLPKLQPKEIVETRESVRKSTGTSAERVSAKIGLRHQREKVMLWLVFGLMAHIGFFDP